MYRPAAGAPDPPPDVAPGYFLSGAVAGKCQLKNDYLGLPDDDPLLLPVSPPLLVPVLPLLLAPLALLLAEPDAPLSGLAGAAWARP